MAVLSVLAHGKDAKLAPGLFEAVLSTARGLEEERGTFYVDLALSAFGAAARRALEALMRSGSYEYQSEFARRYVAEGLKKGHRQGREEGRQEGRQRGRQEGLRQGLQQGRQQGREEGHLEGERRALLRVLKARGLAVHGEARQRLLACTEVAQIERWLDHAVTVQSVEELFEPRPRARPAARPASARLKARTPRPRNSSSRS
jgi:hypothetical protein